MNFKCFLHHYAFHLNTSSRFDHLLCFSAPSIKSPGISGILYLAEPLDACSPLTNEVDEGINSFALIIRGECPFDEKVMAAQKAGFKVAIVYDNIDGAPLVASNVLKLFRKNETCNSVQSMSQSVDFCNL